MNKSRIIDTPADAVPPAAFTVNEFCRRNDICRATFYNLVRSGALKAKKNGAKTIVLASDELDWLKSLPDYVPRVGTKSLVNTAT